MMSGSKPTAVLRESLSLMLDGSINKVENGSSLVEKTNQAFSEIEKSIGQVARLIDKITDVSRKQSQGVSQVKTAMSDMNDITQKNSADLEEMATGSEEMHAHAARLKEMVRELLRLV